MHSDQSTSPTYSYHIIDKLWCISYNSLYVLDFDKYNKYKRLEWNCYHLELKLENIQTHQLN